MKRLEFEGYNRFVCEVSDIYDTLVNLKGDEITSLSIVAKYDEMRCIINELVCAGYGLKDIELYFPESLDYNDEYCCTISNTDGEPEIWCCMIKSETGYTSIVSDYVCVLDNCSSKVLQYIECGFVVETGVKINHEDENEKKDLDTSIDNSVYVSRNKNGEPVGFTVSKNTKQDGVLSFSSISHYCDDRKVLNELADIYDVKL